MKDDAYGVRAVERASAVMAALADADRSRTIAEIAARANLSVPTTFRLLRTLQGEGLVMTQPAGGYTLGFRLLEWSHALLKQLDVVAIARPTLSAVRDQINETAAVSVRAGDYWFYAAHAEASQPLRRVLDIGERLPLYAGACGKVLLAGADDAEIDSYLTRTEFVPLSPTTPSSPDVLREQIAIAREQGYTESLNERGAGGAGIAAPIRAHDGRVVGALEVSGPMTRLTDETRPTWLRAALLGAGEVSSGLGYRQSSPRWREDIMAGLASLRCDPPIGQVPSAAAS